MISEICQSRRSPVVKPEALSLAPGSSTPRADGISNAQPRPAVSPVLWSKDVWGSALDPEDRRREDRRHRRL